MALRTKIYPNVKQTFSSDSSTSVTLVNLTKRTYIKKIYLYVNSHLSSSSVLRLETVMNGETIDTGWVSVRNIPNPYHIERSNSNITSLVPNFGIFPVIYNDNEAATYVFTVNDILVDSLKINLYGSYMDISASIETLEEV